LATIDFKEIITVKRDFIHYYYMAVVAANVGEQMN
jgi:hypothetical protein